MERNRVILTDRERQQQERERQEQCNAEQAVTKHFEESLRRAKEKVSVSKSDKTSFDAEMSFLFWRKTVH